jgi:hypothetical protein
MNRFFNSIGRHAFLSFGISVTAGLMLALAVGAVASTSGDSSRSTGVAAVRQDEIARSALPDTAVMSIFARPARPSDSIPSATAGILAQFSQAPVPDYLNPGTAEQASARRALVGAGLANASLFLVPTAKGSLCMAWSPDVYGGGCTQGFESGVHVIFIHGFRNGEMHLWGIRRDDVSNIDAIVDGQSRPVVLGENSFFFEGATLPSQLDLTLTDGSHQQVNVGLPATLK